MTERRPREGPKEKTKKKKKIYKKKRHRMEAKSNPLGWIRTSDNSVNVFEITAECDNQLHHQRCFVFPILAARPVEPSAKLDGHEILGILIYQSPFQRSFLLVGRHTSLTPNLCMRVSNIRPHFGRRLITGHGLGEDNIKT